MRFQGAEPNCRAVREGPGPVPSTLPGTTLVAKKLGLVGGKLGRGKHRGIAPDFEIGLAALRLRGQQEVRHNLRPRRCL